MKLVTPLANSVTTDRSISEGRDRGYAKDERTNIAQDKKTHTKKQGNKSPGDNNKSVNHKLNHFITGDNSCFFMNS